MLCPRTGQGPAPGLPMFPRRRRRFTISCTFATACFFLGLPLPSKIDGKPVEQVLPDRELLKDAKPADQGDDKTAAAPADASD